jgi:hypothetical protein
MPLPERKLDECAEAADCDLHHLSSRPCCRATTRGVFLKQVNSLRQFGAILLLLVSCGAPAMACITPDTRMTVEERACCRVMKNQCGEMEMPASHDCCKGLPTDINTGALKTDTLSFHPAVLAGLWASSFEIAAAQGASHGWVQRPADSPPKSPPSAITVLRV